MESALANASRILPLVTTAHLPSAANNNYWPEIYTNQSLVDASHPGPYSDTPAPKVFGNVSPLDPQLFSRMNDFADALLAGDADAKYSPIEVAQWLDGWAAAAQAGLTEANKTAAYADGPEYRRFAIDIAIQIGMGRFFAAKFQSGVLYRTFEKTGDRKALEQCLAWYRKARSAFAETAARATGVYLSDITVGELPQLRGHWSDRLPAIDRDIDLLAAKLADAKLADAKPPSDSKVTTAVRVPLSASHKPADAFTANRPLPVELSVREKTKSVRLWYRHVDQAERYESTEMTASGNSFRAVIPSDYTNTQYPIEYYFEVRTAGGKAGLYPGFLPNRPGQPYFVVRRA